MTLDYSRIAYMALNLMLFVLILRILIQRSHRKKSETPITVNRGLILEADDLGAVQTNRVRHIVNVLMKHDKRKTLSLNAGSYILGSNMFFSFFPRYIFLVDSSNLPFRLAMVIKPDAVLQVSILRGCLGLNGITYEEDPDKIITIHKGESFWIGQTEIKVR